jgi:hypothetical protein
MAKGSHRFQEGEITLKLRREEGPLRSFGNLLLSRKIMSTLKDK